MIVGICGLIGSGKNTVADWLISDHGFKQESFASSLKDAVAAIFGWPRLMLEGTTDESRAWRETVDGWWASRLNIPHLTPRWVLQHWGTEVLRGHFHDDIWIASCEHRLLLTTTNVVITDLRFPNEFASLRRMGATVLRVQRGPDPDWFAAAAQWNTLPSVSPVAREAKMLLDQAGVHASEWSWAGQTVDHCVINDGTLEDLHERVNNILYKIGTTQS